MEVSIMVKRMITPLEKAKFWLKTRPYFSIELERKLLKLGYLQSEVDPVITLLKEELVLNDEAHFKNLIENMQLSLLWGSKKITQKLVDRGNAYSVAREKTKEYYQKDKEPDIIEKLIQKVTKLHKDDVNLQRKTEVFLYNRGFENTKKG